MRAIVANVSFMDRTFRVLQKGDGFLLQLEYMEADIHTGKVERQRARKWYLSPYSTETEIVETAFKACRTSMDHVLKEHFLYEGARVYSPHFNVRGRLAMAEANDFDGRDHATSLEVVPTDKTNRFDVYVAGERVGAVRHEPEFSGGSGAYFGECPTNESVAGSGDRFRTVNVVDVSGPGTRYYRVSQPLRTKTEAARWVLGTRRS